MALDQRPGHAVEILGQGAFGRVIADTSVAPRVAVKHSLRANEVGSDLRRERASQRMLKSERAMGGFLRGDHNRWIVKALGGCTRPNGIELMGYVRANRALAGDRDEVLVRLNTRARVHALLHDLMAAVLYLHEDGVTHRDIKPANVMYQAETGAFLLGDFGLACVDPAMRPADPVARCPRRYSTAGTGTYLPPDSVYWRDILPNWGSAYDRYTSTHPMALESARDLWAVGVTVLQMATSWDSENVNRGVTAAWPLHWRVVSTVARLDPWIDDIWAGGAPNKSVDMAVMLGLLLSADPAVRTRLVSFFSRALVGVDYRMAPFPVAAPFLAATDTATDIDLRRAAAEIAAFLSADPATQLMTRARGDLVLPRRERPRERPRPERGRRW